MSKIVIYEDNAKDLSFRYAPLARSTHDVTIYLHRDCYRDFGNGPLRTMDVEQINNSGLKAETVLKIPEPFTFDAADYYFIDSLGGGWHRVASQLPKDKVYIASSDDYSVQKAQQAGYNTINPDSPEFSEFLISLR